MRSEQQQSGAGTLAIAIERGEWERIMLHLFVVLAGLVEREGRETIDDLIELLDDGGVADDD